MITYVLGDLLQSPARVLVNTVNTVGVMGKGIAKDFKLIYPEMFQQYQKLCEKKMFNIGQLWLYKTPHKWILNFPTKENWRQPSKLEYIEAGLRKFTQTYADKNITSIAFPALGCGNGELNWETQVRPLMEKYLQNIPADVYIYLYSETNKYIEHRNIEDIKEWLRSEPQSLPFSEVWEDIVQLLSRKNTFYDLEHSEPISVVVEGRFIHIYGKALDFKLEYDEMLDLWQHIRSLGFFMNSSLPGIPEEYIGYLIAILQELPYLNPVVISSDYDNLRKDNSYGLQYIAPHSKFGDQFSKNEVYEVKIL